MDKEQISTDFDLDETSVEDVVQESKVEKKDEAAKTQSQAKGQVRVDSNRVRFTESVRFFHANVIHEFRVGQVTQVSDSLLPVLLERKCIELVPKG